jgi:hypothetical protein
MRSSLLVWCLALAVLALGGEPAWAQAESPPSDAQEQVRAEAREAFRRGVSAARAGQWEEARQEFTRSLELVPSAVTRLNLAGTQINTGHLLEGYENYQRILYSPADAASHRALVERVVAELETRIPRVRLLMERRDTEDTLWVDGAMIALGGDGGSDVRLDPGMHHVEVRRPGKTREQRDFAVSEGQELVLDLDEVCRLCDAGRGQLAVRNAQVLTGDRRAATPADWPLVQSKSERARPLTSYVAYGVGAAGAVLLAVTGPLALADDHDLAKGCGRQGACSSSDVAATDRLALAADIGLGVAVGGLLVGTIALVTQRRGERRVALAPSASRQGAGLVTRMSF